MADFDNLAWSSYIIWEEGKMRKISSSRIFFAAIFILIGLLFLFKQLGVIDFGILSGFKTYWPIGLILAGFALMLGRKWLSFTLVLLTAVIGIMAAFGSIDIGEERTFTQEVLLENRTQINLDIDYGVGELEISKGDASYALLNMVTTSDLKDPSLVVDGSDIRVHRSNENFHGGDSKWDMQLSPDTKYALDLDYGVSDVNIDLRGLKVVSLDLDSGVSDTTITFDSYPTVVDIDTGISDLNLKFPSGYCVVIEKDTGLASTDFEGFIKKDGKYYSPGCDGDSGIVIDLDAGISDIKAVFY